MSIKPFDLGLGGFGGVDFHIVEPGIEIFDRTFPPGYDPYDPAAIMPPAHLVGIVTDEKPVQMNDGLIFCTRLWAEDLKAAVDRQIEAAP